MNPVIRLLWTCLLVVLTLPDLAFAATLTVPDDHPTIQAALDSGAEVVLVRPGVYPEAPVVRQPVDLRGLGGPDSLPVVAGLVLEDVPAGWDCKHSGSIRIVGFHFTGPVVNTYDHNPCSNPLGIVFTGCVMDSGVTDAPATVGGQLGWGISDCRISGDVRLLLPETVNLQSCEIDGVVVIVTRESAWLQSCRLEGASALAVSVVSDDLTITGNTILGHANGIRADAQYGVIVTSNRIEASGGDRGIDANGGPVDGNTVLGYARPIRVRPGDDYEASVRGNRIRGAGPCAIEMDIGGTVTADTIANYDAGVRSSSWDNLSIEGIVFDHCGAAIVVPGAHDLRVSRNVFTHCGSAVSASNCEQIVAQQNCVEDCGGSMALSGWVSWITDNTVRRCGGGISLGGGGDMVVTGNVVTECAGNGLTLSGEAATVNDNQVEDCTGWGATVVSHVGGTSVERNRVARCGAGGMSLSNDDWTMNIRSNSILSCGGIGLAVRSRGPAIESNVIGHCWGNGIDLTYTFTGAVVRSNTAYLNEGAGIRIAAARGFWPENSATLDHNIAHGNLGHGLARSSDDLAIECNDWYVNQLGAVSGGSPAPTDLAVDPLFCDISADNVMLASSSPLANAPGCGLIGAKPVGCIDAPTPTLVTLFEADRAGDGVRIRWHSSNPASAAWLERAASSAGPWTIASTARSFDGDVAVEIDAAAPDAATWYRLVAREGSASRTIAGPIDVTPRRLEFSLKRVEPSPASGPVRLEFTLGSRASIEIELFDLQGRSVASLARGEWSAGRHAVTWSGDALPPGIYLVRYGFPGGQECRRVVLSR